MVSQITMVRHQGLSNYHIKVFTVKTLVGFTVVTLNFDSGSGNQSVGKHRSMSGLCRYRAFIYFQTGLNLRNVRLEGYAYGNRVRYLGF